MHLVQIHKVIVLLLSMFYLIGLWHRGDRATVKETGLKFFYCIYFLLVVLSFAIGAITNDRREMTIFLSELSIGVSVLWITFCFSIWKQNQIRDLLNCVCVFTIHHDNDYNFFNVKQNGFMKFVVVLLIGVTVAGSSGSLILSFLGNRKTLFMEIAFPLDYGKSDLAFWIATFFILTGTLLATIGILFNVITCYLLLICSLRYEVLGNEIKNMGRRSGTRKDKTKETQIENDFLGDLEASIDSHIHIAGLATELESFFSSLFFIRIGTSGLCICGSIYCLAFNTADTLLENLLYLLLLFYFVGDVFIITYLGNETILSSDRLTYSLFESDWYNQSQSTKRKIIICGEYMRQPKQLQIGKLYPLTLRTFTRILNSAYSMFNILKNFQ